MFPAVDLNAPAAGARAVLRTGVNAEGAGSAFLELGRTKVVCLVFVAAPPLPAGLPDPGPVPAPSNGPRSLLGTAGSYSNTGSLLCDLRFAPFARKARKAMAQDAEDRALSSALCNALLPAVLLDRYPKASIEIVALVLEDDGGAWRPRRPLALGWLDSPPLCDPSGAVRRHHLRHGRAIGRGH